MKLREFITVWWQYRKAHSWGYAAEIAWAIAFKGAAF